MERTVRLLFRRDSSRDRLDDTIPFEGYQVLWPDGRALALNVDAFCKLGQRLLGLGKALQGCNERVIELICFFISTQEERITRLPGHRVRRFFIDRHGQQGRLHFMDGSRTAVVLDLDHDDPPILHLFGLGELEEGQRRWVDLAARTVI
jgi:hypothetical protein